MFMLSLKHQAMDHQRIVNKLIMKCIQAIMTIQVEYGAKIFEFLQYLNTEFQDMMRRLPKEEREQIELQVEGFKKTKRDFEREVLKWDDRGNDIIVLAKKMCIIMMEMTDFTR